MSDKPGSKVEPGSVKAGASKEPGVPPSPPAASPAHAAKVAPPAWWRTLRADPPILIRFGLGALTVAVILFVWWFLTRGSAIDAIVSPAKLPAPGETFGSFDTLVERDLGEAIYATLKRVFIGILWAAVVGVILGVLAAAYRGVLAALTPLAIFLRSVPMGALLPLTLLLFGGGEKQKEMFIFIAVLPFVFADTVAAIASVPERYVETAQTLGATRFQIVRKVLFPLALPDITTSLRFQFGLALGYITLAEAIAANAGLGKLINDSQTRGFGDALPHVYLLLFLIAALAFTLDALFRILQRGFFTYRKDL